MQLTRLYLVRTAVCPFPPYKDSDIEATPCPDATLLDRDDTHVDALLSYLTFHKHVATILNVLGFETAKGRDVPRDSLVIVTQVSTFDSATLEEILCWPLRDRTRIARALFAETSGLAGRGPGGCHFSGVPLANEEGRARAPPLLHHWKSGSELTLPVRSETKPVLKFPLLSACARLVGGDAGSEQGPGLAVRAWRRHGAEAEAGLNGTGVGAPTLGTCAPAGARMFVHYVRAMERRSVWQRMVDALYWVYCLGMAFLGWVGREGCYDPFKVCAAPALYSPATSSNPKCLWQCFRCGTTTSLWMSCCGTCSR